MSTIHFLILFFLSFLISSPGVAVTDKVTDLPGQPPVNFSQHAGYITVDVAHDRRLFYYFVEASVEPASKPVVLWLHGGPGCSAVGGAAFSQHGPFLISGEGLIKNPYSWNTEANMLYLDSPAGVGFSYSRNTSDYLFLNDDFAARDHLVFLQHWFNKFPNFRTNNFFIAGESYAGHFAPQLALLILQTKSEFNLKGISIGNPLLDFDTDFTASTDYLWQRGVISDSTYELLSNNCSYVDIKKQLRATNVLNATCFDILLQMELEVNANLDVFDISNDVCPTQKLAIEQLGVKRNICIVQQSIEFFNRKDVQQALHGELVGVKDWTTCSANLVYNYTNLENPALYMLGTLVKAGVRVLAYCGDEDSVIPCTGTRPLIKGLAKDLGLTITRHHEAWFKGDKIAGWTQVYGDILTFATVRGAGHSTPIAQPERSLEMMKAFWKGKPLPKKSH
ncbi:serine carboxypeptidase-like 45 [Vicia villosa]|uniref:serine carboxypeptidase-like 45 n=1 Tax=Vicia villosa TaxID=3911 RepID=UPI00273C1677|nr:serine carboxypeptidase-like 45 [Vicia villosa]